MLRRGSCRYTSEPPSNGAAMPNSPLLWVAQPAVIRSNDRPQDRTNSRAIRELPNARDDRCRGKNQAKGGARPGLFHPAGGFEPRRSRVVSLRFLLAILRPPAQGSAGALLQG